MLSSFNFFTMLLELPQEAQVVTVKIAYVINAVLEEGGTLDPHAKGEPIPFLWIVSTVGKHHRVDHTCSGDFEPPRFFAKPTAGAVTGTAHINFNARFSKWEVTFADAHFAFLPVHLACEFCHHSNQIG